MKHQNTKAVIFDYGGVIGKLVDCRPAIAQAFGVTIDQLNAVTGLPVILLSQGKISEKCFWNLISTALHTSIPEHTNQLWTVNLEKEWRIDQKVRDFSLELQGSYTVAILSNIISAHSNYIRNRGGFEGYDHVFLSHDMGMCKPDPEIYLRVANVLNVAPKDCLIVDDTQANLDTAQQIGMQIVLAKTSTEIIQDVESLIQ